MLSNIIFRQNMFLIKVFVSPPSYLYQIAHLGDDDEEPEFSSAMPLEEGDTFFFQPRPLKNLVLVDELDSLSPILFCQVWVFPVISIMSSASQLFWIWMSLKF